MLFESHLHCASRRSGKFFLCILLQVFWKTNFETNSILGNIVVLLIVLYNTRSFELLKYTHRVEIKLDFDFLVARVDFDVLFQAVF